jgi:hypothetical protein
VSADASIDIMIKTFNSLAAAYSPGKLDALEPLAHAEAIARYQELRTAAFALIKKCKLFSVTQDPGPDEHDGPLRTMTAVSMPLRTRSSSSILQRIAMTKPEMKSWPKKR